MRNRQSEASLTFKELTPENWDQPDPVMKAFGRVSPLAGPIEMRGQDWARQFLALALSERVPESVRDLFRVAQGAAIYGWYFYPLFFLAEGQLHRVAEAAAREAYRGTEGDRREPRFALAIDHLRAKELITQEAEVRWQVTRELRNYASPPREAAVMPPGSSRTR